MQETSVRVCPESISTGFDQCPSAYLTARPPEGAPDDAWSRTASTATHACSGVHDTATRRLRASMRVGFNQVPEEYRSASPCASTATQKCGLVQETSVR